MEIKGQAALVTGGASGLGAGTARMLAAAGAKVELLDVNAELGAKIAAENGGIFLHANPWAIIAEALVGNGERAFQYYTQINPAAKNDLIEVYQCEPYVYAQNILGDEHPQFGVARNSWLTGTASWAYQAATQYILGIRPAYDGLVIDPCLPTAWDGFRARRRFRGATYAIQVRNPEHVCHGVKELRVDGCRVEGNLAPLFSGGGAHTVEVWMGAF